MDLVPPQRHRGNSGRAFCSKAPADCNPDGSYRARHHPGYSGVGHGRARDHRWIQVKGGGIGRFILGAINVLVGLLLLGSPIAAALAVPLVFGVLLLIQGVGLIVLAFRVRI